MFTLNDILQGNGGAVHLHSASSPDPEQVFPAAQHDSHSDRAGAGPAAPQSLRNDGINHLNS